MASKYSSQLIDDTISCFKAEDGVVLSHEEAIAVLDSLAGFYQAFKGLGGAVSARPTGAEPSPEDLINIPLNNQLLS